MKRIMQTKKVLRSLVFGLLGVLTFGGLWGCHRNRTPDEKAAWISSKLKDKLDLNEQQSQQLDVLSTELVSLIKDMRAHHESDRQLVISQISQDEISKDEWLGLYQKRRQTLDERLPKVIDGLYDWHRTLNAEQKEEIAEFLGRHHRS